MEGVFKLKTKLGIESWNKKYAAVNFRGASSVLVPREYVYRLEIDLGISYNVSMDSCIDKKCIDACFFELETMGAKRNVPMCEHTSFKIGGAADIMFVPEGEAELLFALNCAKKHDVPVFVMGNGSNLLVSDKGIRGLVIKLRAKTADIQFDRDNMLMTVSASTLFSVAVKNSVDEGFMGLEWGAGIPGTVGGAVSMNAGAYGGEIKDRLKSVRIISQTERGYEVSDVDVKYDDLAYRYSRFSFPNAIVLSAVFSLMPDDSKTRERMDSYTRRRTEKQPLSLPSAGSVFKRPEGHFAGALIEEAKLKGFAVGGAQVSELHAGFIVNTGGATAEDVIKLIEIIKNKVYEKSGVMLCEELKLIGG